MKLHWSPVTAPSIAPKSDLNTNSVNGDHADLGEAAGSGAVSETLFPSRPVNSKADQAGKINFGDIERASVGTAKAKIRGPRSEHRNLSEDLAAG